MAKVLIIRDINVTIEKNILRDQLHMPVEENQLPTDQGIAIIDCSKINDQYWQWAPDYIIKVGECNTKRNRIDLPIGAHQDPEGTIITAIKDLGAVGDSESEG